LSRIVSARRRSKETLTTPSRWVDGDPDRFDPRGVAMRGLRPVTLLAVAAGFVAGGIGGAVAFIPESAPARDPGSHAADDGTDNAAFHQSAPREFRDVLAQMKASNIVATVLKLVGFGTRQTLSSQTDPNRGVGAARDFIFNTLQGYAAASGGRMTVGRQSFIQPVADRIPTPTEITNVVATLKGDQPESANRCTWSAVTTTRAGRATSTRRATHRERTTTDRASRQCWRWAA
jgi:hypothetical protein